MWQLKTAADRLRTKNELMKFTMPFFQIWV
jgi:hypothetical protein